MQIKRRIFLKQSLVTGFGIFVGGKLISNENWLNNTENKKKLLRFVVASDGHYGQPKTDYKQYHQTFIDQVNELHKKEALDFCVINGDIIHDNPIFLPEVKSTLDKLIIPYYVTQGNHDRCTPSVWEQTWGMPQNHVVEIKDQVLLLATTSNEKGEYLCADLNWFKDQLEKYNSKTAVYIFIHITPEKWTDNGVSCMALHELFSQHKNIVAVFNGHDHDQDHFRYKNNIPFLFDGHIGGNWGVTYRGFRLVEFQEDRRLYTCMMNPTLKLNEAYF
jgi:predicted phosphodiesterase